MSEHELREKIIDAMCLSLMKGIPQDMPRPSFQDSVEAILALLAKSNEEARTNELDRLENAIHRLPDDILAYKINRVEQLSSELTSGRTE